MERPNFSDFFKLLANGWNAQPNEPERMTIKPRPIDDQRKTLSERVFFPIALTKQKNHHICVAQPNDGITLFDTWMNNTQKTFSFFGCCFFFVYGNTKSLEMKNGSARSSYVSRTAIAKRNERKITYILLVFPSLLCVGFFFCWISFAVFNLNVSRGSFLSALIVYLFRIVCSNGVKDKYTKNTTNETDDDEEQVDDEKKSWREKRKTTRSNTM